MTSYQARGRRSQGTPATISLNYKATLAGLVGLCGSTRHSVIHPAGYLGGRSMTTRTAGELVVDVNEWIDWSTQDLFTTS